MVTRVIRIVVTCCLVVVVVGTAVWFAQQWFAGNRAASSIERGLSQIGSAPAAVAFQPGDVIGRILIPSLGLDAPLIEMADVDDKKNLEKGPAHVARTALPGANGNCVIAGHRTTFTRPFLHIDQLKGGDEIKLIDSTGRLYTYTVTGILVVDPSNASVMDQTATPTVTLIACHPPYSARYRMVVQAAMSPAR